MAERLSVWVLTARVVWAAEGVVKVETDRKELEGALRALKGAVASRPGIPALTGVLVEGDGAGLATLTATDLETTATARIGAGNGSGFRALVPFKILADTVKAASTERVGLERVDGHVKVAGASIRLLPEEDFPKILEPVELVGSFDAAELRDVIGAVAPAASRDEARSVFTGLLLEIVELGSATLTATDSYRLHTAEIGRGPGAGGGVRPGRYIIPEGTASYVAKLIGKRPASARVVVRCSEGAVMFELGTVRVTVRLIEGEFPNWRQLIPEGDHEDQGTLTYDRAELEGALKAAEPFCGRDHVGGVPVRIRLAGGVSLSASAPDLGEWSAVLRSATWTGPELAVAFTPAYLAGCVRAVGDGARMMLRDGLKPAVLTSAVGTVRALVMPVRMPVPVVEPEPAPEIHEPTADERAAGEAIQDPTDPGAAEAGEPAEPEPAPVVEADGRACEGCDRRYEPEPEEDRGLCCICERDQRMDAELGPDWRERVAEGRHEPEPAAEPEPEPVPAVYPGTEDDRRVIRKANDDEPEPEAPSEPEAGEAWAELADVGTVAGAGRSAVRVRVVVGPNGSPMVDARRFIDSPRYNGPTRKGFALRPAEAGALAELLRDAQAAAEAL